MEKIWKLVWLCVVVLPLMTTGCSKDDEGEKLDYSLTGTEWTYVDLSLGIVKWFKFKTDTEAELLTYFYYFDTGGRRYCTWEYKPPIVRFKFTTSGEELLGIISGDELTLEGGEKYTLD